MVLLVGIWKLSIDGYNNTKALLITDECDLGYLGQGAGFISAQKFAGSGAGACRHNYGPNPFSFLQIISFRDICGTA